MSTRLEQRVVPKATTYSISPAVDRPGTIFTNRGASGAVDFNLFTPTRAVLGWWYDLKLVADQTGGFVAATAGDIVTKNDVAANSVKASTAGEKIGATMRATCLESAEGTFKWLVEGLAVGHTYTVAT